MPLTAASLHRTDNEHYIWKTSSVPWNLVPMSCSRLQQGHTDNIQLHERGKSLAGKVCDLQAVCGEHVLCNQEFQRQIHPITFSSRELGDDKRKLHQAELIQLRGEKTKSSFVGDQGQRNYEFLQRDYQKQQPDHDGLNKAYRELQTTQRNSTDLARRQLDEVVKARDGLLSSSVPDVKQFTELKNLGRKSSSSSGRPPR
jgi:hypothetical protein